MLIVFYIPTYVHTYIYGEMMLFLFVAIKENNNKL